MFVTINLSLLEKTNIPTIPVSYNTSQACNNYIKDCTFLKGLHKRMDKNLHGTFYICVVYVVIVYTCIWHHVFA